MTDLDTMIRRYAELIDDASPDVEELADRARRARVVRAVRAEPTGPRRRWLIVAVAAAATLAVVGGPILFWASSGNGEPPVAPTPAVWTSFTAADGLTDDCVFDLAVAADGKTWTIGPCGLTTFDGSMWSRVEVPTPFYQGIGDPLYTTAVAGSDGSMWFIGDQGGVYRWGDGTWTHWPPPAEEEFSSLAVTPDATAWGVAELRLWRLEAEEWIDVPGTEGVTGVVVAPDGTLWTDLGGFDGEGIVAPFPETNRIGLSLLGVGPDDSAWFNGWFDAEHVLYRYDGREWTSYPVFFAADVAFEADGTMWVAVSETLAYCPPDCEWLWGARGGVNPGAYRFDGQEWTRFTTEHGLVSNDVTSVAVEEDGSIWFGTRGGVTRYQPNDVPTTGDPLPEVIQSPLGSTPPQTTTTAPGEEG